MLVLHLASNNNTSLPFSGTLVCVWFGSGDFARYKHGKLCASVADEYWEVIYNGIKLLHEISITAIML